MAVESLRAECILQTPDNSYGLGYIVLVCLPRIITLGVATADEVDIDTLQQRPDEERTQSTGIYIGDVMRDACARKPGI
ncbi:MULTISPECIES: hypothetical protein [Pseudomonas syringae group]|uniref:Uncharacterized protein n=5 Tax=Pseudomonas syringae group TaxID=136849 RepID=A0A0Q0CBP5_PSESX|nr:MULTISPECIES: hypothetical protein [Pseudomonas syringae group]AAO55964.1 hypothetical protein PSPTO_2455 [Pseudomonas syringae pv. tomato str. DC3000]KPB82679.1 Uncharacterized protein AC506_0273 [Pseudomonas syringae pv. maculicola str. M6]KPB92570.1 Uncharacterized protein AC502_0075 [Pseudomonas syringae pv. maculicola]KPX75019.1 hypothetical protein ALO84_101250 [Pseudomonas syringae pv. maculicola]KPY82661.1 Uncharacterized protein ALO94_04458 [Pseudomonas syringae pv. spinaceae]